eukprot:gene26524-29333_t
MTSLFFGKSKPKPKPKADTGAALQGITNHLETLTKKEEHLAGKILDMKKQAVTLNKSRKTTDKKKALQLMKQIKMYETQRAQLDGTMQNMLAQKIAIEGMAMTNETVKVMESTQSAFESGIDLDHAEDVVADVQDAMERQAEIAAAIAQPMDGGMMPVDEDELMEELNMLEDELAEDEELPDLSSLEVATGGLDAVPQMTTAEMLAGAPSAPTSAPTMAAPVADEMDDLLAWAN